MVLNIPSGTNADMGTQGTSHINEELCHRDDEWKNKMPLLCKREDMAWRSYQC